MLRRRPPRPRRASLDEAAAKHEAARATLLLLLELPAASQASHLANLHELLTALTSQLRQAASALASKGADVDEAALSSPKVAALLEAILALRTVGRRLAAAREWYASAFVPSASAAVLPKAGPGSAAKVASEIGQLVRASHAAVGREAPAEEEEPMEPYWAAALPIGKRCALSLLPLRSEEAFPHLPPTVEWGGRRMHAPCANLWAHCVRNSPP